MIFSICYIVLLATLVVLGGVLIYRLREMQTSLGACLWRISDHADENARRAEERYLNLYSALCEATEYAERSLQTEISTQGALCRLLEETNHPPDEVAERREKRAEEKRKDELFAQGVQNILNYDLPVAGKKGRK